MNIYAVLDLKAGQVVRGVAGRRETYRPVCGVIARTCFPADVARGFVEHLGLSRAYVADLDAIAGQAPDWATLAAVANTGLSLLVDAGCKDPDRAAELAEFAASNGPLHGIVIGLESLTTEDSLPALVQAIGADRAVFSLDLQDGRSLAADTSWRSLSPQAIASRAWDAGFRRMIVLDLAAVGVGGGPVTLETCRELRGQWAWRELISGGGVRSTADLLALEHAGCDSVLIASALHAGTLRRRDLAGMGGRAVDWERNGTAD